MTDMPLNTLIQWTEEDRERGKCPVPDGSDVTVWFDDGGVERDNFPQGWAWDEYIIAYMVHSMPKQPREFWVWRENDRPWFVLEKPDSHFPHAIHVREVLE